MIRVGIKATEQLTNIYIKSICPSC